MKKHLILLGLALLGLAAVLVWNGCKKDSKSDGGQFTCKITSPQNGAELSVDDDITVTVESKGAVAVTAYLDDVVGGAAMTEPFTMTISSAQLSPGSHTIKAIAVTQEGKQAESSITVTITDGGSENESPNFVTFANGEIPSSWKTNTWVVDVAMGYDDNYALRADNGVASVVTQKTMNDRGYIVFYIRGGDYDGYYGPTYGYFFDFYIDNVKAEAVLSVDAGNNWRKWTYNLEKGTHSFRWENTNGAIIHLDVIKFVTPTVMIGDSYQGGIIFYIDDTGEHGLIAAKENQGTGGIQWLDDYSDYVETGATGTAVGTGKSNTEKIIKAQGTGSYAAKLCADLVIDGYDDWFLPSKDELNLLYQNKDLIGGFSTEYGSYYWSSSEYNKYSAIDQSFNSGYQDYDDKTYSQKVRAVREF